MTNHRHDWALINAREQECLECDARRDTPQVLEFKPVWLRRMQETKGKDLTGSIRFPDGAA